MYEYQDAGERAPYEVQRAIDRFHMHAPDHVKENVPLLYWLLGSGTPPYKMTREESDYVDVSPVPTQQCANCVFAYQHVTSGNFICSQIRGRISPPGWCRLWRS